MNNYSNICNQNKQITIDTLNQILGNKKDDFTNDDKTSFVNKFYLDFAPDFQTQFENVIKKLKETNILNASDNDVIFYYANICYFLQDLITKNQEKENRLCTRNELFNFIKESKKSVFSSAFKEYKGEDNYFKYVKSNFAEIKKYHDNFIFFGDINIDSSKTMELLISDIIKNYYIKAQSDIRPLTFIIYNDESLLKIKKELIRKNIFFNDGYESIEFNSNMFFEKPIINKKVTSNGRATDSLDSTSFKLRLLSYSNFKKIECFKIEPDRIYYFDAQEEDLLKDKSMLKIEQINTKQIKELFNS